jgi:hypothetical protein
LDGFSTAGRMVGVVATRARQSAGAAAKAFGLAKAVGGACDLEFVVSPCAGCVIEVENVVGERFDRRIRKVAAPELADRVGQSVRGGLEMALHADFELPFGRELGRIENGLPQDRRRISAPRGFDVGSAGAVAAAAVYALGQVFGEADSGAWHVSGLNGRVRVMAEQALEVDLASKIEMVGAVIAGGHSPEALSGGIPGNRRLEQTSIRRSVQVRTRVIAGTEHVVDLLLHWIRSCAGRVDLIAADEEAAISFKGFVDAVREGMLVDAACEARSDRL